ncbi:MAG: rhomboid family intramembrane serine protease [Nanoarchaeota archaeon]
MLKNKNKFYSLWLLLIISLVFVLQLLIPKFTDFFLLNGSALTNFQYWRFLTAIFLHGSLTHLLFNLFALFFFGIILEKEIGSKNFLLVFFFSGILANLIAVNFYESSLGASGAIYGIIGMLTVIKPLMMVWTFGMIMPMFIASIIWITADVLRTLGAFGTTNIGSIAHLSGIAIGILLGFLFRGFVKR